MAATLHTLLVTEDAGTVTITLNRPHARNAMSLEMIDELLATLRSAEGEPSTRAVVLRGAGGHFCAGADIKDMAAARMAPTTAGVDAVAKSNERFGQLCLAFARTPLPVLCLLEGAVMGGGFGLVAVADVSIASTSTQFALPETSLGIIPAQIAPFLVERLGFAHAKRLVLTGGRMSAERAFSLGLVQEVHDSQETLEAALDDTLAKIYACAPEATRVTKQLMQRARREPAEDLIAHAAALFSAAVRGPEGAEGTRAFLEKRAPGWARKG